MSEVSELNQQHWKTDIIKFTPGCRMEIEFSLDTNGLPALRTLLKNKDTELSHVMYGKEVNRFIERAYLMLREYRAKPTEARNEKP